MVKANFGVSKYPDTIIAFKISRSSLFTLAPYSYISEKIRYSTSEEKGSGKLMPRHIFQTSEERVLSKA